MHMYICIYIIYQMYIKYILHVYTCVYLYIHTHTYTHTHTHTQTSYNPGFSSRRASVDYELPFAKQCAIYTYYIKIYCIFMYYKKTWSFQQTSICRFGASFCITSKNKQKKKKNKKESKQTSICRFGDSFCINRRSICMSAYIHVYM